MTSTVDDTLARLRQAAAQAGTEDEARAVADRIRDWVRRQKAAQWEPYPWQHPHHHPDGWVSTRAPGICDEGCYLLPTITIPTQGVWLELGGRGTGKTEGAAHYINTHVEGPPCDTRIRGGHKLLIIGPTQGDAIDAAVTGPSGLQTMNPAVRLTTTRGGTFAIWPNGARARILGGSTEEDVKSTRASGNVCRIYLEEAAAIRRLGDIMTTATPGLRTGTNPHWVAATTPKNRPEMTDLRARPGVVITKGRTRDAHRLDPETRRVWEALYANTTAGRQELDAEELQDVEGALWVTHRPDLVDGAPNADQRPGVDNDRVDPDLVGWVQHDRPPALAPLAARLGITVPPRPTPPAGPALTVTRTVVAVDPPGGRTECGITVEASAAAHGYTLADLSLKAPPNTWALVALCAYFDYGCEGLVIEHTYGGDMVPNTVATLCTLLDIPTPPIFRAKTKVGKRLRAEPVQALYQQHREHHVGVLPGLETEQTTWVPDETTESPNRIDAHVHGQTYLLVNAGTGTISNPASLSQLRVGSIRG